MPKMVSGITSGAYQGVKNMRNVAAALFLVGVVWAMAWCTVNGDYGEGLAEMEIRYAHELNLARIEQDCQPEGE